MAKTIDETLKTVQVGLSNLTIMQVEELAKEQPIYHSNETNVVGFAIDLLHGVYEKRDLALKSNKKYQLYAEMDYLKISFSYCTSPIKEFFKKFKSKNKNERELKKIKSSEIKSIDLKLSHKTIMNAKEIVNTQSGFNDNEGKVIAEGVSLLYVIHKKRDQAIEMNERFRLYSKLGSKTSEYSILNYN